MSFRRIGQVFRYGWLHSAEICSGPGVQKSRIFIFLDIVFCFIRFNVWSNQYKQERLYELKGDDRKEICLRCKSENDKRTTWVREFFSNYRFLRKWSNFRFEANPRRQPKRCRAYAKRYSLPSDCFIGYDVIFHKHHFAESQIVAGKKCLIAEHVDIDYTGGLTLGRYVSISEGVKILTHNHGLDFTTAVDKGCIPTPLHIQDLAWIGARSMILPGVKEIGRGAIISADTVVRSKVLPYSIVVGNHAKIVGFRMSPEEIVEYEKKHYPEDERISIDSLNKWYEKYSVNRRKQTYDFLKP